MKAKIFLKYTSYVFVGILTAVLIVKLRALFFLPQTELPIIVYNEIKQIPTASNEISQNLFHTQISDLSVNGFEPIPPAKLVRYKAWGLSFPTSPVMLVFDTIESNTINYVATTLMDYQFKATICIPEESLQALADGSDNTICTKENLLNLMESEQFSLGLYISSLPNDKKELKKKAKNSLALFKELFDTTPKVIIIPEGTDKEKSKAICRAYKSKLGICKDNSIVNSISSKTRLSQLTHQRIIGGRTLFSIKAIRHPGAISQGEIFISQPSGERFKACVSVFDKNFVRLIGEKYDALPIEPALLGELPNTVEYPISIFITDETGIFLYKSETFNRYTIERGEAVPLEIDISDELEKALSEIDIPLDVE